VRPYLKESPTQKMVAGVAQEVEHLPSKVEALSPNPNTAKKKKKDYQINIKLKSTRLYFLV
jgi:hypothetical protein